VHIDFDVVDGATVTETLNSIEIVRPVMVHDVPGDCSTGQNPAVLLQALSAPLMPAKRSSHPSYVSALLEERRPRSVRSVSDVLVELVYRQRFQDPTGIPGNNVWTLTDDTQTAHLITYGSADGTQQLLVWYEPSATDSQNSPPANVAGSIQTAQRIVGVQKIRPYRTLTVSSVFRGEDWEQYDDTVHDMAGKINADVWGGHSRGTWMFLGPKTRTFDPAQSVVYVDLRFIQDPQGDFYPILAYLNEKGVHPANSLKEKTLRDRGLPVVGQVKTGRGLSIASIYREAAFSNVFSFTPKFRYTPT
jgi:hypothetical protein